MAADDDNKDRNCHATTLVLLDERIASMRFWSENVEVYDSNCFYILANGLQDVAIYIGVNKHAGFTFLYFLPGMLRRSVLRCFLHFRKFTSAFSPKAQNPAPADGRERKSPPAVAGGDAIVARLNGFSVAAVSRCGTSYS